MFASIQSGPTFLKDYKNPCWLQTLSRGANSGVGKLRCLPYVYILGVEKCGTTELYDKLTLHPQVAKGKLKEPIWWCQRRFGYRVTGGQPQSVESYLNNFADATKFISDECPKSENMCYHKRITGKVFFQIFILIIIIN